MWAEHNLAQKPSRARIHTISQFHTNEKALNEHTQKKKNDILYKQHKYKVD